LPPPADPVLGCGWPEQFIKPRCFGNSAATAYLSVNTKPFRSVCDRGSQLRERLPKLIVRVVTNSMLRSNIREDLSKSVVADESGRKSDKNSNGYPRKKKKRETGEPTINELTDELWEKANAMLA
jgi:hypothetical protein